MSASRSDARMSAAATAGRPGQRPSKRHSTCLCGSLQCRRGQTQPYGSSLVTVGVSRSRADRFTGLATSRKRPARWSSCFTRPIQPSSGRRRKRGVFAHISDADIEDWQSSIDIVLRRFAEYHELEGAFGRRALTERAKSILMERHAIDESSAFELLREHSRASNRKLIDLATAVVDGHRLLPQATAGSCPVLTRSRARRGRRSASSRWAPPSHTCLSLLSRRMPT